MPYIPEEPALSLTLLWFSVDSQVNSLGWPCVKNAFVDCILLDLYVKIIFWIYWLYYVCDSTPLWSFFFSLCDLCFWHKPSKLANSLLFCSCIYFCLYGLFNCVPFHKFFRRLSAFSLCSSGFISALLVLSTIYLFMKVSFSLDIILVVHWA